VIPKALPEALPQGCVEGESQAPVRRREGRNNTKKRILTNKMQNNAEKCKLMQNNKNKA